MKWIVAGVLAVLAGAAFIFLRNSVKIEYVNGLPAYSDIPGREYIFERDCYIFKFKDHNTSWPLVGSRLTVPDLPERVDAKSIGVDFPNVRILDVVHTGDRVRVVSVRRDKGKSGTSVTFEILFQDEEKRKYPRLDAYWLLDHAPEASGKAPTVLPAYVASGRSD